MARGHGKKTAQAPQPAPPAPAIQSHETQATHPTETSAAGASVNAPNQASASQPAQVSAAHGGQSARPSTPPLSTHAIQLDVDAALRAPHHVNAGRIDTNGRVPQLPPSPSHKPLPHPRRVPRDGIAPPHDSGSSGRTRFQGPLNWNGLVHESGNLAHPDDPFVSASSGPSLTRLAGSAPVFIPAHAHDDPYDSPGTADRGPGAAAPNGDKSSGGKSNGGKSNGDKSNGNSPSDAPKGSRASSSHPVIVSTPDPKAHSGKGKQAASPASPPPPKPTRFLVIRRIRAEHFDSEQFLAGLKNMPRFHESVTKLGHLQIKCPEPTSSTYDAYIFCDSLQMSKDMYRFLKRELVVAYLSAAEFLAAVPDIPEHVTTFCATVKLTALIKKASLRNRFGQNAVAEMSRTVAAKFGKVVSFDVAGPTSQPGYEIMIEYDSVNDAIDAKLNTDSGLELNYGRHPHLDIEIVSMDPDCVSTRTTTPVTPVTPVSNNAADPMGSPSPSNSSTHRRQDNLKYSPTGRTAVREGQNGKTSTVPGYKILDRTSAPSQPQHPHPAAFHPDRVSPLVYFHNGSSFYQGFNELAQVPPAIVDGMPKQDGGYRPQDVSYERIENGLDCRTTLMIRNVPPEFTIDTLYKMLMDVVPGEFDFAYNRIDFRLNQAVGYAFVNFITTTALLKFVQRWLGRLLPRNIRRRHQKPCAVSYANVQGYECLVAKFRNSSILDEAPGCRPQLYWSIDTAPTPDMVGQQRSWPGVDNQAKKNRSTENAQIVGLYARRTRDTTHARNRLGIHSQFDRGTPAQRRDENQMGSGNYGSNYQYNNVPVLPGFGQGRTSQPRFMGIVDPDLMQYEPVPPFQPYTGHAGPLPEPRLPTAAQLRSQWLTPWPFEAKASGSMLRTQTHGKLGKRGMVMPAQIAPVHDPNNAYHQKADEFVPLLDPVKNQPIINFRAANRYPYEFMPHDPPMESLYDL